MKLCFKIAVVAIIMIIIPVIILTVHRRSASNQTNILSAKDQLAEVVSSEKLVLDSMFSDCLGNVKILAGHKNVLGYVLYANEHDSKNLHESDDYGRVAYQSDLYMKSGGVYAIEITDRRENVIFSTMEGAEGKKSEFNTPDDRTYCNGISSLFMYNNIPVFCIEREIFNDKNEPVGKLCFVYEAGILANSVESLELYDFNRIIIIDSRTNIIESPFKMIRAIDWNSEYKNFSEFATDFVLNEGKKELSDFFDYEFNGKDKSACIASVTSAGWSVAGVVNLYDYNRSYFNSFSYIWIIVAAEIILIIIALNFLLSPVSKILDFLEKRKKGDNSAVLDLSQSDELGNIGYLMNHVIDKLSASEEKYRAIAEMSDNIVFDISLEKNTVTVSSNFNKKFSFRPKDDTLKESFLYKSHIYKDDKTKYLAGLNNILETNETKWEGDFRMKTLYGDFSWIKIKAKKLLNRKDVPTRIVGIMTDIDRQKESELNLIQKASLDALTQLYNRETFYKMLRTETEKQTGKSTLSAIMFIDLDDFKFFNDRYGHKCGDEVLKFTASTIKEACFERGFGGRFGGDEFIICFTGLKLIGNAGEIAGSIINTLSSGFDSDSEENTHLSVNCSIGIAFLGENGRTPEELIAAADSAMYKIKKHGKSNFAYASAGDTSERDLETETSVIDSDMTEETNGSPENPDEEK